MIVRRERKMGVSGECEMRVWGEIKMRIRKTAFDERAPAYKKQKKRECVSPFWNQCGYVRFISIWFVHREACYAVFTFIRTGFAFSIEIRVTFICSFCVPC